MLSSSNTFVILYYIFILFIHLFIYDNLHIEKSYFVSCTIDCINAFAFKFAKITN